MHYKYLVVSYVNSVCDENTAGQMQLLSII